MQLAELRPRRRHLGGSIAAVGAIAIVLTLSDYWTFVVVGGLTTALVALSVGVVYGRTGLVSLCQLTFAAIGAWTVMWLNVHTSLPFVAMLAIGGLSALPFGLGIGMLSLRLRGVNLAIATLGFASAAIVVFRKHPFPGTFTNQTVARPPGFGSEHGYFVFCCLVFGVVVVGVSIVARTRSGRAWLAVRHSERATAALGLSVARVKLLAFGTGAVIAAVAGGLMSAHSGTLSSRSFEPFDSMLVFAVAVLAGARYVDGAIAAGLLGAVLPELFRTWGIPLDVAPMLFGVGVVVVLAKGAEGAHGQMRASLARLRNRRSARTNSDQGPITTTPVPNVSRVRRDTGEGSLILDGVSVAYGAVLALDNVALRVAPGTVHGLIGPNGAGKSTLIDAVTGFVGLDQGTITIDGVGLAGMPPHRRVGHGVRRTFQQGRTIPDLTVGEYLQVAAGRAFDTEETSELLGFFGCPSADRPIAAIDVATRRLVEVAGCLAARPAVVLLDEPGAGLGEAESALLASRVAEIPSRFGCSVLLVEHDMQIVQVACDQLTVLDFGHVIATGEPSVVLDDPEVRRAYLGDLLAADDANRAVSAG